MNATRFEGYGGSWKTYPDSCTVVVCLQTGKLGLELRLVECSPGMHEALGSTSSIAKRDMVIHTCNLSTWELEAIGSEVERGEPGLHKTLAQRKQTSDINGHMWENKGED